MICVIMLHMRTEEFIGYSLMATFFYAVPLYFFISGYLLSASASRAEFRPYLWKRVKGLLIPYVIFFVISFLWMNTVYAHFKGMGLFGFQTDWTHLAKAFLFAGEYLYTVAIVPPPIWFLHALFFCSILFYFFVKIRFLSVQVGLAAFLCVSAATLQNRLQNSSFWLIRMLPTALFFMLCGHFCRQIYNWSKENTDSHKIFRLHFFWVFPLFLLLLWLMVRGRGDMWNITSEWYFPAAFVFFAICYLLTRETDSRLLLFVGRNSLLYLGIQPLILVLPFAEGLPEYFRGKGFDGLAVYLSYFAVTFLMISGMVALIVLVRKFYFAK